MVFTLTRLNTHAFKQAWQRVVERNGVFRTAFVWKNLENAVQVVVGSVSLAFAHEDWRELSVEEQQRVLDSYLETDRMRAFDLTNAPLIRLALFQATDLTYHFVWTHHHLLLDGWSMSIVAKELFALYELFCQGSGAEPRTARPYRDYIAYLNGQDVGAAEAYWRSALKGCLPGVFDADQATNGSARRVHGHAEHRVRLSGEDTAALQAWGRQHRLTINTLIQGAWAMVLGNCLGSQEVLFGTVVSGRPASLTGIESMVGLFINTLTVRTRLVPGAMLVSWLDDIQNQQAEMQQYDYASLVNVHEWSALPKSSPMFDSILVVENYPMEEAIATDSKGVGVRLTGLFERLNYPMTIVVAPGPELGIKIVYDNVRFSETMIDRIARHIQSSLRAFIKQDDIQLNALQELLQRIETDELDEVRTRLTGALRNLKRKPVTQSPRPA